ncbi:amidohydrolase [Halostagnicola bangensis]
MTEAADRLFVDGEIHTLERPSETYEAMAVRDGEIVRLGPTREIAFLEGVETDVIDCDGRVVLPGFIDAHTHMENLGRSMVHADLAGASTREAALERLSEQATANDREWILGFGYDESDWNESRYLTREDLDAVSDERPVIAVRVDMHTASLNTVALEKLADAMAATDIETEGGEPTGVVLEEATDAVWEAIEPDYAETRELVTAAISRASELGVTCVHDMNRQSASPRVYRDLEASGDLECRVRLNYWSDHLESAVDVGLATNAGSEFIRTGSIKTFTDGSIGGRTAKVSEPYADGSAAGSRDDHAGDGNCGQWVVDPAELEDLATRADDAGFQLSVHAIGDEAIEETISVLETTTDPAGSRHRIEHAELASDDAIERMAKAGIIASVQPNFHQWAGEGGLYDQRLGQSRRRRSNRLRTMLEAGVALAFGSDCMPLDPLLGVHHAVNAPAEAQRLPVTEALRAYTLGGAYAGFDEDRLGTLEVGKRADLVVLEASPWEQSDRIEEIDVSMTVVDGEAIFER